MDLYDWKGARITGSEGAMLVTAFNKQLTDRALTKSSHFMNLKLNAYSPWMSSHNLAKFSSLNTSEYRILEENQERVKLQRSIFSQNGKLDLSELDPLAQDGVTIMSNTSLEWSRFKKYVDDYYSMIKKINPFWFHRVNSLINEVIPMEDIGNTNKLRTNGSGLSTLNYRNAIFLSLPEKSDISFFEFCLNFSHELGHQALMTYEHFDDLVKVNQHAYVYSVIRETNRPAIQSLHALIAVVYMLEFMSYAHEFVFEIAPREYILERKQKLQLDLSVGLEEFKEVPLTSLGKQILLEIKAFELWESREQNAA